MKNSPFSPVLWINLWISWITRLFMGNSLQQTNNRWTDFRFFTYLDFTRFLQDTDNIFTCYHLWLSTTRYPFKISSAGFWQQKGKWRKKTDLRGRLALQICPSTLKPFFYAQSRESDRGFADLWIQRIHTDSEPIVRSQLSGLLYGK